MIKRWTWLPRQAVCLRSVISTGCNQSFHLPMTQWGKITFWNSRSFVNFGQIRVEEAVKSSCQFSTDREYPLTEADDKQFACTVFRYGMTFKENYEPGCFCIWLRVVAVSWDECFIGIAARSLIRSPPVGIYIASTSTNTHTSIINSF